MSLILLQQPNVLRPEPTGPSHGVERNLDEKQDYDSTGSDRGLGHRVGAGLFHSKISLSAGRTY